MKFKHKLSLWAVGAFVALAVFSSDANALTPQPLDIKVRVNVTKDLSVSATYYHFGTLSAAVSSNSATAIAVTNASGGLVQTYTIQGADAASEGVGTTWTLAGSPSTDTYTLQGQFASTRPDNVDGTWASDAMTTSAVACSDTQFGNGVIEESGSSVSPLAVAKDRNLWFRIKTPTVVSDLTSHKATITLAVE